MERQALRIGGDRVDERVVDRAGRSSGPDEGGDRGSVETLQRHADSAPQAGQVVGRQPPIDRKVLTSPRKHQCHGGVAQAPRDEGDRLTAGGVGMVEVVDPDDTRDGACG